MLHQCPGAICGLVQPFVCRMMIHCPVGCYTLCLLFNYLPGMHTGQVPEIHADLALRGIDYTQAGISHSCHYLADTLTVLALAVT